MGEQSTSLLRRNRLSDSAVVTCFAAGAEYMAAGLSDGLVHILTSSGQPVRILSTLDIDRTSASSLAIETDHLIIGRRSGRIETWDLKDEYSYHTSTVNNETNGKTSIRQQSAQAHRSSITALISRGGEELISSSRDGTIKIWYPLTWECKYTLRGHSDVVIAIAAHEKRLVSGSYDGTCRLWNLDSGELLSTFAGRSDEIRSIAFDGSSMVSGGVDGAVHCRSTMHGNCETYIERGHASLVSKVNVEKEIAITAGADGMLKAWSVNHLELLWEVKASACGVNTMQARNGKIVTGGSDDVVKVWRLEDGALLKDIGVKSGAVWKVGFVGDGNIFHVYWKDGAVLDVWCS